MDQPAGEAPIPLVRITLTDGDQFELTDGTITEESVSGMCGSINDQPRGKVITIPVNQVESIEIGNRNGSTSKTVGRFFLVVAGAAALLVATYFILCAADERNCYSY